MRSFLALAVALSTCAPSHAAVDERILHEVLSQWKGIDANDVRRNYDACDSPFTFSVNVCRFYRLVAQEKRLDRIYRRSLTKAENLTYRSSLVKAERSWLAYRKEQCEFEGKMNAGGASAEDEFVLRCKEELTRNQADRLEVHR